MILRWIIYILLLGGLAACAQLPTQQLDATRYMVGRAQAVQAPEYAPTEYQAAEQALQDAEQMITQHKYAEAEDSLDLALHHARRAVTLTETRKQKEQEEARRAAREAELAAAKAKAERARAKSEAAKVSGKAQTAAPETAPAPAKTYEVQDGENLWIISNQAVVYGDGLLWPLLYQANRDQIKDPRQIYPGQILNIRRDLTSQEMEDARQKARESDIFPVPKP